MKKMIGVLCLILIAGVAQRWYTLHTAAVPAGELPAGLLASYSPLENPQPKEAEAPEPFADFPLARRETVSFDVDAGTFGQLSAREQADQMRDWLLFAIVSASGATPQQINQALYDLPTVRSGYLQPIANYEYGQTRCCVLQIGLAATPQCVALVPIVGVERQRDLLAHIADQYRKNVGQAAPVVHVFEYELDPDRSRAVLLRHEAVDGSTYFTPSYGYAEVGPVRSVNDLADFVSRTDDVVMAMYKGDGLYLGGRKLAAYRGVRVEDVAALWQSESLNRRKKKEFDTVWDGRVKEFNREWAHKAVRFRPEAVSRGRERQSTGDVLADMKRDTETREQAWEQLQAEYDAAAVDLGALGGSGFSLDPTYDFAKLADAIEALPIDEWALRISTPRPAKRIVAALRGPTPDIGPLLDLIGELRKQEGMSGRFLAEWLLEETHRYSYQTARYDGPLQGTEVGMVLFYTDLLAKMWALDYKLNAPAAAVDGFFPLTQTRVSPVYFKESNLLSNTRLWFGTDDTGFANYADTNSLMLARRSTRVFAAGSNPLKPGQEAEPNAQSAAFLGWWNDHYEDVAEYEPEYQRLNGIMKWSLVINWLYDGGHTDAMDWLDKVRVNRSAWFPDWVRRPVPAGQQPLRFTAWDSVKFYPKGYLGRNTEAMPLLSSEAYDQGDGNGAQWVLSGGVSLAQQDLFKVRSAISALGHDVPVTLRRSNMDFKMLAAGIDNEVSAFNGTKYVFDRGLQTLNRVDGKASLLKAIAKTDGKLRGRFTEVKPVTFARTVERDSAGLRVSARAGEANLGNLRIGRTGVGYRMTWDAGDLGNGQSLARDLSRTADRAKVLETDARVELAFAFADGRQILVKTRGGDRWTFLAEDQAGAVDLPPGWDARVADFRAVGTLPPGMKPARMFNLRTLDTQSAVTAFGEKRFARIPLNTPAVGKRIEVVGEPVGVPGKAVEFATGDGRVVPGRVIGDDLYLRVHDLSPLLDDPRRFLRAVNDPAVRQAVASNAGSGKAVRLVTGGESRMIRSLGQAQQGEWESVAKSLAGGDGPITSTAQRVADLHDEVVDGLKRRLAAVDDLLLNGREHEALAELDTLRKVYGPSPDVTARQALASLATGRNAEAARAMSSAVPRRIRVADTLYRELAGRVAGPEMSAGQKAGVQAIGKTAEWQDAISRFPLEPGKVSLRNDGDRLLTEYQAGRFFDATPINGPPKLGPNDRVYVESGFDLPGLHGEDTPAAIQSAVTDLWGKKPGVFVELPRVDVAHYDPDRIIEETRRYQRVTSAASDTYAGATRVKIPNLRYPHEGRAIGPSSRPANRPAPTQETGRVYLIRQ